MMFEEQEHQSVQKQRRINRNIRKEGIEDGVVVESKRKIIKPKILNIDSTPKVPHAPEPQYEVEKIIGMKVSKGQSLLFSSKVEELSSN